VEGLAWLASATAFAVSMSATPGPNNAMVTASGATWGFRRTVPHMLGVSLGFPAMLVAVALGAGEVLRARPWLHEALRWVGAAYLLWLAWKIGAAEPGPPPGQEARDPGRSGGGSRPLSFVQAALFQWVNPKAWVIALGAVAAYATAAGSGLVARAAMLALIFLLVTLPVVALWTLVGAGAARVLRTRRALRAFNLAMAALLVLSLAPMVLGG
jgi:threonine/homoserine/homoserine lactone efflux protein